MMKALPQIKVVLFEDDPKDRERIRAAISKHLPPGSHATLFDPVAQNSKDASYDDRLSNELASAKYSNATLFVTDRDLSRTETYQGLSEAIVSKVAAQLGTPICKYARGATDELFERQRSWGDAQIILDSADIGSMAAKISILAHGFLNIRLKLDELLGGNLKTEVRTPAAEMAHILGRAELSDQIALYASGDQKMVAEILPFADRRRHEELRQRLPSLFGYWLFDSILRFPGLLVNAVAAASYLDISVPDFEGDVRNAFKSALYRGPFNDKRDPLWWRSDLDTLIAAAECADGNSFASKKLGKKVPPCSADGSEAGWYCMVTKTPVGEANSVGNISWFPPGADLARIRKDVYEQMGPWLGLF
jgi:hypothetical protein